MKRIITALILIVTGTSHAWAWSSEGHRIIAEIAEQFLEPAAAQHGAMALRQHPISAAGFDAARDCSRGNCVVAKIDQFSAELRDRNAPPKQRLEALKFLVHFIGDVHQPLHASDNGDRGGNNIHEEFKGRKTNLHAVWDTGLLGFVVHGDERT